MLVHVCGRGYLLLGSLVFLVLIAYRERCNQHDGGGSPVHPMSGVG